MKNKIFSLFAAIMALLMTATSCDDWSPADRKFAANTGGVSLSDLDVKVNQKTNTPQSRAGVDVSGFLVTILDQATGQTAMYDGKECAWTYGEMPEVMTLPVGKYTVMVESHKAEKAAWAAPHYEGSEEFEIADGQITSIGTVTCVFTSVKVSVRFADDLKAIMGADARVKVVAGEAGGELEWSADETRDGYFAAVEGSNTLVATFSGTVKGSDVNVKPRTFTDLKAGNYYIITFSLKAGSGMPDETGGLDPTGGISVDSEIEEGDENGDIPGGEEPENPNARPDDEEWPEDPTPPGPENPADPKDDTIVITPTGDGINADFNVINDALEGRTYSLHITSKNPFAHLNVKIESAYLTEEFLNSVGLTSEFDLANPDATRPGLEAALGADGFGFPTGSNLVGQTEVDFDLSPFIPLLNLSGATMVHTFTLTVADDQNPANTKTVALKFQSYE